MAPGRQREVASQFAKTWLASLPPRHQPWLLQDLGTTFVPKFGALSLMLVLALIAGAAEGADVTRLPLPSSKPSPQGVDRYVNRKGPAEVELEIVDTLPGSPVPRDPFEPHMPDVDVMANMDLLFAKARAYSVEDSSGRVGARHAVVVTPGRNFLSVPLLDPERAPADPVKLAKDVLRSERPLNVTVVAYTKLDALMDKGGKLSAEGMNRSIPFLGYLMAFAYAGHTVVVFEGHPSAFEPGVRNADVLLIDSAMLPFLQKDWATVAFAVMAEGGHILVHDRKSYSLLPVARSKNESGWRYTEPDGEGSYANSLLTAMTRGPKKPVRIVAGRPLPDLAQIATDAGDSDWVSSLPFKYDQLDADQVIEVIVRPAGRGVFGFFTGVRTLRGKLVTSTGERKDVSFKLIESRTQDGKRQLLIERR